MSLSWEETKLKVASMLNEGGVGGWEQAWSQKMTPWDAGQCSQSLVNLIETRSVPLPTEGRALVPGCGTGYDALYIASKLGIPTLGIDVSESAIKAAQDFIESTSDSAKSKVTFKTADFFAFTANGENFDLVYDYAFFIAIPPSLRYFWGTKMSSITKPDGVLVTVFPPKLTNDNGPPFTVRPEHYDEVLSEDWAKILVKEPDSTSRHMTVVWQRLR